MATLIPSMRGKPFSCQEGFFLYCSALPGVYESSTHGPLPICFVLGSNPPSASAGMMNRMFGSAITLGNAAFGVLSVNLMVLASMYSTLSTKSTVARLGDFASVSRAQEYLTSSELTARPLTG